MKLPEPYKFAKDLIYVLGELWEKLSRESEDRIITSRPLRSVPYQRNGGQLQFLAFQHAFLPVFVRSSAPDLTPCLDRNQISISKTSDSGSHLTFYRREWWCADQACTSVTSSSSTKISSLFASRTGRKFSGLRARTLSPACVSLST